MRHDRRLLEFLFSVSELSPHAAEYSRPSPSPLYSGERAGVRGRTAEMLNVE